MNKLTNTIVLIAISLMSNGCFVRTTSHRNFFVYKKPITEGNNIYKLRFDGIYVSVNSAGALAFYPDGKVKCIGTNWPQSTDFWRNPDSMTQYMSDNDFYFNSKEIWGDYSINSNGFYSEDFGLNYTEFIARQLYITKGRLLNDTTVAITSLYNTFHDTELISDTNIYRFYKTKLKPDSTKIWYLNKRWYKKGVHESRKRKD